MDDSPASKLPVELWIKIAIILRDWFPCPHLYSPCAAGDCPRTYFNAARPLSESCRFLCTIVQPILYEHVKVLATYVLAHHIPSLASTLSARPDLRSSVRTLKIHNIEEGLRCDAFLKVLPLLVEVRFLSLEEVYIEGAIVQLLRNAPHLHTLHICNAGWGMEVPEKWSEGASFGRNLRELHIYNMGEDILHQNPRSLQLFVPTVTKLSIDARIIAELTKLPSFLSFGPPLLQLVTEANDPIYHPSIHHLLSRSPNIRDLEADGLSLVSSIDDEYLPNLRSINASSSLVTALLRGRPIRSITTEANPKLFLKRLPKLETLLLTGLSNHHCAFDVINALWTACPGLIRLELECQRPALVMWIKIRLTSALSALPRLQILNLNFRHKNRYEVGSVQYPLSEEMQAERERIAQIKRQHCPDLCDVWLNSECAWIYEAAWIPQRRIFLS